MTRSVTFVQWLVMVVPVPVAAQTDYSTPIADVRCVQYTSHHLFEDLADGGLIGLTRDSADTAGVRTIRDLLRGIAAAFTRGDFALPGEVHSLEVPGTRVMAARRQYIDYLFEERPGGGPCACARRVWAMKRLGRASPMRCSSRVSCIS